MTSQTILLIHQSFPGQFKNLAESLAADGHKVYGLGLNPQGPVQGVTVLRYSPVRPQMDKAPYLMRELDAKILRAESVWLSLLELRDSGLQPDVIYAHPGWGEALFVKQVWPQARLVIYAEWFYQEHGQEVNFDKEFPPLPPVDSLRLTLKNTAFLHALNDADATICPTYWQKSRLPQWAQEKTEVIHDGLTLDEIRQGAPRRMNISAQGVSLSLSLGMPIVTFVARYLEPVRGFHTFMRALPDVLKAIPDAQVLVLGNDAGAMGTGYGRPHDQARTWRAALVEELGDEVDWNRVHFLGKVDRKIYLAFLRLSACHVYMTMPFILSWSFLEAAALGLPIIAADTAPVLEFSRLRGLELTPYGDAKALARKMVARLRKPVSRTPNELPELALDTVLAQVKSVLLEGLRTTPHNAGIDTACLHANVPSAEVKPAQKAVPTEIEISEPVVKPARPRVSRKKSVATTD